MTHRRMSEIVYRQIPTVMPKEASVRDACRVMRDRRIGAILVVDENGALAGLFTGRDAVVRVLAESRDPRHTSLAEVMTADPDTITSDRRAIDALRMMHDGGYRHAPVVDGGKIVGIVSKGDFHGLERARLDEERGYWEVL